MRKILFHPRNHQRAAGEILGRRMGGNQNPAVAGHQFGGGRIGLCLAQLESAFQGGYRFYCREQ